MKSRDENKFFHSFGKDNKTVCFENGFACCSTIKMFRDIRLKQNKFFVLLIKAGRRVRDMEMKSPLEDIQNAYSPNLRLLLTFCQAASHRKGCEFQLQNERVECWCYFSVSRRKRNESKWTNKYLLWYFKSVYIFFNDIRNWIEFECQQARKEGQKRFSGRDTAFWGLKIPWHDNGTECAGKLSIWENFSPWIDYEFVLFRWRRNWVGRVA